jgi:hypothetical protein
LDEHNPLAPAKAHGGYGQKAGDANAATCAQNSGIAEMRIAGANGRRAQPASIAQARANGRNRVENCLPIFSNRRTPLGEIA